MHQESTAHKTGCHAHGAIGEFVIGGGFRWRWPLGGVSSLARILSLRRVLSLRSILTLRRILALRRIRRLRVLEGPLAGALVDIEPAAVLLVPAGNPRRRDGGRTLLLVSLALSLALRLPVALVRQASGDVLDEVHLRQRRYDARYSILDTPFTRSMIEDEEGLPTPTRKCLTPLLRSARAANYPALPGLLSHPPACFRGQVVLCAHDFYGAEGQEQKKLHGML